MTPDDIIDFAQGIVSDYTDNYPTTKSVMYQRINIRQNELFALVASWDKEYYGVHATAELDSSGCADLAAMREAGIFPIERVDRVEILDRGTNENVDNGDEVNIVPAYDTKGHIAPRATLRSHILGQYDTDLQGVVSLRIFYSRQPKEIDFKGLVGGERNQPVEIPSPWHALLAWDLARDLIRRAPGMDIEKRMPSLEMIAAVETEVLAGFENHVRGFAHARQDRFNA